MERLNDILRELGISKVKLAKFLGVSRQMIYNYLELDDLNKWPKDKKVMLLNLLGIKTPEELDNLKIDTDYIMDVEARINSIFENTYRNDSNDNMYNGLKKNQRELLKGIVSIIHEKLEDDTDEESYNTMRYLYYFLQAIDSSKELKYFLAYVVKSMGFVKPLEFVYNEDEQFAFESIMFSGMTLYNNGGRGLSKVKLASIKFILSFNFCAIFLAVFKASSAFFKLNSCIFKSFGVASLTTSFISLNSSLCLFIMCFITPGAA